jgi:divalent metal cation (Fe/Co/Zn/Cd) transporter
MEATRAEALRRGIRLEIVTIAWMLVEACVALGAGILARSVLLTAFGVDSVVELLSGIVLFGRLRIESSRATAAGVDRLEARTASISAGLLLVLCGFVLLSSVVGLALRIQPEGSVVGVAVSAIAIVAMPLLARGKYRVNAVLRSPSLRADIAETVSCAYLAAVTLAGLAASMLFGWWWAQYVAALVLLAWLVPETREAFEHRRDNEPDHGDGLNR